VEGPRRRPRRLVRATEPQGHVTFGGAACCLALTARFRVFRGRARVRTGHSLLGDAQGPYPTPRSCAAEAPIRVERPRSKWAACARAGLVTPDCRSRHKYKVSGEPREPANRLLWRLATPSSSRTTHAGRGSRPQCNRHRSESDTMLERDEPRVLPRLWATACYGRHRGATTKHSVSAMWVGAPKIHRGRPGLSGRHNCQAR